jgi:hypothetical protein
MNVTPPLKGALSSIICDEDSSKECPYKMSFRVTGPGVLSVSSDGLVKCCHAKKQLDVLRKITLDRKHIR